jgi:hypothetical protein
MIFKKFTTTNCDCSTTTDTQSGCGCSSSAGAGTPCPACGTYGRKISALTAKSQLKKEVASFYSDRLDSLNFCTNPSCSFVYYDDSGSALIHQDEIKSKVTLKNNDLATPLCYCQKLLKKDFYAMVAAGEENIAAKLKAIIASGKSFCEKSNPKGVCCTEDVKAFVESHGITWEDSCSSGGCC